MSSGQDLGSKLTFVGVRFHRPLKILYYIPHQENYEYSVGEIVEVETTYGGDIATVVLPKVELSLPPKNLRKIVRVVSPEEYRRFLEAWKRARSYIPLVREKVAKHNLNMHIIDAKYTPDGKRFVVFFSAESRVDFRKLVIDLARVFRMRIELYQIGARDGASIIGGIGVCGRPLCCHTFLTNFQSISLSMLKQQDIQLNPDKLTGLCGRLKCCLAYELETYTELSEGWPKIGDKVKFRYLGQECEGVVRSRNLLARYLQVEVQNENMLVKIGLDDILETLQEAPVDDEGIAPELRELDERGD